MEKSPLSGARKTLSNDEEAVRNVSVYQDHPFDLVNGLCEIEIRRCAHYKKDSVQCSSCLRHKTYSDKICFKHPKWGRKDNSANYQQFF